MTRSDTLKATESVTDRYLSAKGGPVAYVINCDCGYIVRAETEDELLDDAEAHIEEVHPDLIGKIGREDFLAMAEEQ